METRYLFGSVKLNDKEKEYLNEKVSKTNKFFQREKEGEVKASIEVNRDKHLFWKISAIITTPKKVFRVKKQGNDFFEVVDMMEEALMKQIRRKKGRIMDYIRRKKGFLKR